MSDGLERVTIVTPNEPPPEGHDEKMIALVDSKAAAAAAGERPEWLPSKFATVEELAASYKELESKLGGTKPEAAAPAPATAPTTPPAVTPIPTDPAAAVAAAGLDMAALNAEYASTGDLSEASRAALAAKGFDKATVDNYIEGQKARATQFQADVLSATPGGAEKYAEMVAWAKANLTEAEVVAYNKAIDTNDANVAKLAVAGLGARFTAAVGSEPTLIGGKPDAAQGDVFGSIAEMKVAMSDKRYRDDPAYRRSVAEKLGRSNIL